MQFKKTEDVGDMKTFMFFFFSPITCESHRKQKQAQVSEPVRAGKKRNSLKLKIWELHRLFPLNGRHK